MKTNIIPLCQQPVCFSHSAISPTYVGPSQVSHEITGEGNCFLLNNRKMVKYKEELDLFMKRKSIRQKNNTKLLYQSAKKRSVSFSDRTL